jgi:methyltransferase (TIGR00027 family)
MRPHPRSVTSTAGLARRLTGIVLGLATFVTWAAGNIRHARRGLHRAARAFPTVLWPHPVCLSSPRIDRRAAMDPARASMTALGAAYRRAYHDAYDTPKVFEDRFAVLFIASDEATTIEDGFIHMLRRARPHLVVAGDRAATLAHAMRTDTGTALVLGRARDNEDLLETAIRNGVTQYVMVGAGFDTFALRRPGLCDRVGVFEIDYPTTQDLKRQRLRDAGLDTPVNGHDVQADFEVEGVADALVWSADDPSRAAFFAWLGVISYLTRPAIEGTFRAIRRIAPRGVRSSSTTSPPRPSCQRASPPPSRCASTARGPWASRIAPGSSRRSVPVC